MINLFQELLQLSICLNEGAQNVVFKKFNNCLTDFCKKENIKIFYYDTIEELNNKGPLKYEQNNLAVGTYIRLIDDEQPRRVRITENYPQINLLKTQQYCVYTLAHEIGHHLAMKNFLDNSESTANHFILLLAEEFLTNIERHIISISLRCFCRLEIPKIKVKRKDWLKFKKENNL